MLVFIIIIIINVSLLMLEPLCVLRRGARAELSGAKLSEARAELCESEAKNQVHKVQMRKLVRNTWYRLRGEDYVRVKSERKCSGEKLLHFVAFFIVLWSYILSLTFTQAQIRDAIVYTQNWSISCINEHTKLAYQ